MWQRLFQHVREQPRSVRDSYAMGGAVVVTGLVAVLWMLQGPGFATVSDRPAAQEGQLAAQSAAPATEGSTPFSSFWRQMRAQFSLPDWSSSESPAVAEEPVPPAQPAAVPDTQTTDAPSATTSTRTRPVRLATSTVATSSPPSTRE